MLDDFYNELESVLVKRTQRKRSRGPDSHRSPTRTALQTVASSFATGAMLWLAEPAGIADTPLTSEDYGAWSPSDVQMAAEPKAEYLGIPEAVAAFLFDGRELQLKPPLVVKPNWDGEFYQFYDGALGIRALAASLGDLRMEVVEQVAYLWETIGLAEEQDLTEGARVVRANLQRRIAERDIT